MNDISSDPLPETALPQASQVPGALVFLARFFGTAVQTEACATGSPSSHPATPRARKISGAGSRTRD